VAHVRRWSCRTSGSETPVAERALTAPLKQSSARAMSPTTDRSSQPPTRPSSPRVDLIHHSSRWLR
jgi:hypothetical protein